jgi:hypothetical protein
MRQPAFPVETFTAPPGISNWPPLVTSEKLAQMPPKLREPTVILGVAVAEMINLMSLYEIGIALSRTRFLEHMRPTAAYPTIHNVTVSVFNNVLIGVDALSGTKETSVNIRRVINAAIHRDNRETILAFHGRTSPEARKDAERMINRVAYLKSRLDKERVKTAFRNVGRLRNNRLAHFDYVQGQSLTTIELRDIQICLINLARLMDLLCRVLVQRVWLISEMRINARRAASEFCLHLLRGAEP